MSFSFRRAYCAFLFCLIFIACSKEKDPNDGAAFQIGFFPRVKSSLGNKENPSAREDYWTRLQIDPATGIIPQNIREKEVAFSASLPVRSADDRLRVHVSEWTSIGPYNMGGRTRAIAVDEEDEKVIIAGGVTGGIWKTVNGGESWIKKNPPESLHSVTTLVQDRRPGKTNTWYYGTGELQGNSARGPSAPFRGDGIFKSTDNGETWTLLPSTSLGDATRFNSQFQYVWKVITNRFEQSVDEVYAAIMGGIAKSVDGGNSWQIVLGEAYETTDDLDLNFEVAPRFTDIVQTEEGLFYAILSSEAFDGEYPKHGVYQSADGEIWTEITPDDWPGGFSRVVIATSVSSPNVLYFLGDFGNSDFLWKFTHSGNGLGQWEDLSANIPFLGGNVGDYDDQDSYNMVLKVHPQDDQVIYLGGTNLYRSSDGFGTGDNISWIGGYDTANNYLIYPNHYVDQHDIFFYKSDPDKMLSVNDGGIFLSESNRSENLNWKPLNNGFVTGQAYTIGFDPHTSFGSVIIGFQDNGSHIAKNPDFNTRWTRFIGGDGGYCAITKDEQYVYASFQDAETYRFTTNNSFGKTSYARVDPIGAGEIDRQSYLFINPFVLDPNNNNVMYLAGGDAVWRNKNLSQIPSGSQNKTSVNWEKLHATQISDGRISAINASVNPAHVVFFGSSFGQLFKIENALNGSPNVTEITSPAFPGGGYISSISIDPTDNEQLMVAFSNYNVQSIFHSGNGGVDFTDVSGNLEENPDGTGSGPSVRWVDIAPTRDGGYLYFTATSTGIYSTTLLDGNNTVWTREGGDALGNVVSVMVKHRPSDGTVFAATHGNGAFQATFEEILDTTPTARNQVAEIGPVYPNPLVSATTIPFVLSKDGNTSVAIYNLQGQKVKGLLNAYLYKGKNYVTWDRTNESGARVSSGTYLASIFSEGNVKSTKLIVSKP